MERFYLGDYEEQDLQDFVEIWCDIVCGECDHNPLAPCQKRDWLLVNGLNLLQMVLVKDEA